MDGADGADGWTRGYGKASAVRVRTGGQGVWEGYVRFVTRTITFDRGVEGWELGEACAFDDGCVDGCVDGLGRLGRVWQAVPSHDYVGISNEH